MKTLRVAAVTSERWFLDAHAPKADSMAKTTRPATQGGSVLPRGGEGRLYESRTGQPLQMACVGGDLLSLR